MRRCHLFFVILLLAIFHRVKSSVIQHAKESAHSQKWKDKISKVLDTQSQELQVLQNLISESEKEIDFSSDQLSKKPSADHSGTHVQSKTKLETTERDTLEFLREQNVLHKLEENSQRMDSMVVFLSDLKDLLSEAISAQEKQMRFETEVIELKEELESLRKEIMGLKKQQVMMEMSKSDQNLQHRVHNDETTIEWLKKSTKELHSQMNDVLKTCNVTHFMHLEEHLMHQSKRQHDDLVVVQREIEGIKLVQVQQEQKIDEAINDIQDIRSWQTNMGQKIASGQLTPWTGEIGNSYNGLGIEEHPSRKTLQDSLSHFPAISGKRSTKLKSRLRDISKTTNFISKRLFKVEENQQKLQDLLHNLKPIKYNPQERMDVDSRLISLEEMMQQYTLTLQNLGDKVNVVDGLHDTNTQIFTTLEGLETKYDEKLTDLQTTFAKLEAAVSIVNNTNEDLKDQQTYNNDLMQSMKKDIMQSKTQLQKDSLRIGSLQTQVLKWASQKCSIENTESIQDIRISTLESLIQTIKKGVEGKR